MPAPFLPIRAIRSLSPIVKEMSLKSVVLLNSTVRPSIEIISCRKLSCKGTNKRWQCQRDLNIAERSIQRYAPSGARSERRFASAPTEWSRKSGLRGGTFQDVVAVTAKAVGEAARIGPETGRSIRSSGCGSAPGTIPDSGTDAATAVDVAQLGQRLLRSPCSL